MTEETDVFKPIEGVVIDADDPFLGGDVQMRVTKGAARKRVKGMPPGVGLPEHTAAATAASAKKRSIVNRYNVGVRAKEMGVDPTEILCLLLQNTPEARVKLNLPANAKTTPALMTKIACELLGYMAPKLRSVEVKAEGDNDSKSKGVQLFIPMNGREDMSTVEGEVMHLSIDDLPSIAEDNG